MSNKTLSLRPKGQLASKATIFYEPERNNALLKREERVAQEWCDFIDGIDFSSMALTNESKNIVSEALGRLSMAYRGSDVPEAQIVCQLIAAELLRHSNSNRMAHKLREMVNYRNQYHYWAVANVELELARYYRWWVDRELVNITMVDGFGLKGPNKWPHITLTRGLWEMAKVPKKVRDEFWGEFEGKKVEFNYSPDIKPYRAHRTEPGTHWALDVKSDELSKIRRDFGLSGDYHFHLTVGRTYDRV